MWTEDERYELFKSWNKGGVRRYINNKYYHKLMVTNSIDDRAETFNRVGKRV